MCTLIKKFLKYFFYCAVPLFVLITGFLAYLSWFQSPYYFPEPTGLYSVGTRLYQLQDSRRQDPYSKDPAHPFRELMIKVWYPAQTDLLQKPSVSYKPDFFAYLKKTRPIISLLSGARHSFFVHELPNVPLSTKQQRYPIILFSPGGGGRYDSNSVNCQELASYGYIVVGISHTYESAIVRFLDGRLITAIDIEDGKNFIERRKQNDRTIVTEGLDDVRFVIDQLDIFTHDSSSFFYEHLDMDHIGIFGQSRGGAVAALACRLDERVKCGVDMDGSLFGPKATDPINKPFMFLLAGKSLAMFIGPMSQESWAAFRISSLEQEQMVRERYILGFEKITTGQPDKYLFVVDGAGHTDFTDNALLIKCAAPYVSRLIIKRTLVGLFGYGTIDGGRVTEITNALLVDFFGRYLSGNRTELTRSEKYKEVKSLV